MGKPISFFSSCLIAVFISPEFLLLLAALVIGECCGSNLLTMIPENAVRPDTVKWAAFVPVSLFVFSATHWRDLICPGHRTASILTEWPNRDLVLLTFKIGLAYQILFSAMAVVMWICNSFILTQFGIVLFSVSILGSIVSAATHYFAGIKLHLLLDMVGQSEKH